MSSSARNIERFHDTDNPHDCERKCSIGRGNVNNRRNESVRTWNLGARTHGGEPPCYEEAPAEAGFSPRNRVPGTSLAPLKESDTHAKAPRTQRKLKFMLTLISQ
jgi:hypothetical protein